ncbi:MAG: N-acetyltransferase [Chloroflexi bacterium]|nr:N-acetyltransferase [Chloroflexota bacterium]
MTLRRYLSSSGGTPATRDPLDVQYRPERPGEEPLVSAVVAEAFGGSIVATLVDRLRASADWIDGLSFVADHEGRLIGHILFTRGLLDAPERLVDVLVLSPVSVSTAFQRMGVGATLIRHGLEQIAARPEPLVFLEGSPGYYRRFGFRPGGEHGFRRPSLRIPEPAFQVIKRAPYEPWMTGTLVYSRVFWDLDCVGLRDPVSAPRSSQSGIRREGQELGKVVGENELVEDGGGIGPGRVGKE